MTKEVKLENGRSICNTQSTSGHETANLVSVLNHTVVTSSLMVAEYFGKKHKDVLRAISMLECSSDFTGRNFAPCTYISELRNGVKRTLPMYYLTRDGFTFLAMGFTGKVAAKFKEAYINAFNEMEELLRKQESTKYAEKMFRKKVEDFNRRMQSIKGNPNYMSFDCLYPSIYYMKGETFERNRENVFAQVRNSYISGMDAAAHFFKTEKELRELKGEIMRFAQRTHIY